MNCQCFDEMTAKDGQKIATESSHKSKTQLPFAALTDFLRALTVLPCRPTDRKKDGAPTASCPDVKEKRSKFKRIK